MANPSPQGNPETKGGLKSPIEIIKTSGQRETPGSDPIALVRQVDFLVQKGVVKLLQLGNTVFVIYPQPNGTAEFHTFTIEDPQTLVQRYKVAARSLKQMGFKKAVSFASSPAFVKMAKATGLPVKISHDVQKYGNKARQAYKFEIDL